MYRSVLVLMSMLEHWLYSVSIICWSSFCSTRSLSISSWTSKQLQHQSTSREKSHTWHWYSFCDSYHWHMGSFSDLSWCIYLTVVLFAGSITYELWSGGWWIDSALAIILGFFFLHEGYEMITWVRDKHFNGGCCKTRTSETTSISFSNSTHGNSKEDHCNDDTCDDCDTSVRQSLLTGKLPNSNCNSSNETLIKDNHYEKSLCSFLSSMFSVTTKTLLFLFNKNDVWSNENSNSANRKRRGENL